MGHPLPDEQAAAAGWLQNEMVPLSKSLGEVTQVLFAPSSDAHRIQVAAMPMASTWGAEVCRRSLVALIAAAAARVRPTSGKAADTYPAVLTLRLNSVQGLYFTFYRGGDTRTPTRDTDAALKTYASDLQQALAELMQADAPILDKVLTQPEALASVHQAPGRGPLAERMVIGSRSPAVRCHLCGAGSVLAYGSYSGVALPRASDLALCRMQVVPVMASHGIFVQFQAPTARAGGGAPPQPPPAVPRPLPTFGEVEERALLVSISDLDDSSRLLQADTLSKLNDLAGSGERAIKRHVELAEAHTMRRVASFADRVIATRSRLILVSSPPCGGVDWLAHTLELQLRLREYRGISVDVSPWLQADLTVDLAALRTDLSTLFTTGRVQTRGVEDGGAGMSLELPTAGYVLLSGEGLAESGLGRSPEWLSDLPQPHFRIQALPLACVSLDEYNIVGGHALLVLRHLAKCLADQAGALGAVTAATSALKGWTHRRPTDHGLDDLAAVASAEWKQINLSFAYELPLYASLLLPVLSAVPCADETYAEARRLVDMLVPFTPVAGTLVPSQSPTRAFIGGAWF